MNTFFEQLKKEAEHIRLSESEKRAMRGRLERAFAESASAGLVPSPLSFFAMRLVPATLSVLLVFGGVAYAAEDALPGEALYAVKTEFNERVREGIARSPEAKARWYAEAAERRAVEAEALAVRGELSAQAAEGLAERLEVHITRAEEFTRMVREEDGERGEALEMRLAAALEAHAFVLDTVLEEEGEEGRESAHALSQGIAMRSTPALRPHPVAKAVPTLETVSFMTVSEDGGAVEASLSAPATEAVFQTPEARDRNGRIIEEASAAIVRVEKTFSAMRASLPADLTLEIEARARSLREALANADEDERGVLRRAIVLEALLKAHKRLERPIFPAPAILDQ